MNIAVIYGGDKRVPGNVIYQTPNTRPWKSYESVAEDIAGALRRLGFQSIHVLPEDMNLGDELRRRSIQFAWLNTGGTQGYNPMAHGPAMLEMFGVPYLGHDPLTTSILDNKPFFKREVEARGLRTSPFLTWHLARGTFDPESNVNFKTVFAGYDGAFVVKPASGRASLHVHVVEDRKDLAPVVDEVFHATQNHVMIERFLPGREFCVAVAGPVTARSEQLQIDTKPFVFSPTERVLEEDEQIFTSMDQKPISADRLRLLTTEMDADTVAKLEEVSLEVFMGLNLETLVRLDLRMADDGELYILEANPKPDLKQPSGDKTSLVSAGLAAHGMDYDDLVLSLFADRIDLLFCQRRGTVHHLHTLFAQSTLG
ncbi:hypothetical protein [Pelagibius sp. Alg239-R121]|uniref:D-alanine--D-alanine ligase family protein n=1 Tax=Pelagibius sp. Alg239-R121 TaxID=2993448 RepID=UPI0024A61D8E|nr:hypothetical protein [Pelagibius sp. Alg239-R121]